MRSIHSIQPTQFHFMRRTNNKVCEIWFIQMMEYWHVVMMMWFVVKIHKSLFQISFFSLFFLLSNEIITHNNWIEFTSCRLSPIYTICNKILANTKITTEIMHSAHISNAISIQSYEILWFVNYFHALFCHRIIFIIFLCHITIIVTNVFITHVKFAVFIPEGVSNLELVFMLTVQLFLFF